MLKTFAAITTGGFVLFTVQAKNTKDALDTVRAVRKRSDTIEKVRLLRADDMGIGGTIENRG